MSFKNYQKYYHDHVLPNLPLLVAVIQTSIVSLSLITATKTQHQAITISKSAEPDTDGWGFYLLYISLVTFWLPWMFILYTHHKKKGNQPKWIYFFHRVFAFFNVLAYVAIVFIRLDLNVKIHEIAANTFFCFSLCSYSFRLDMAKTYGSSSNSIYSIFYIMGRFLGCWNTLLRTQYMAVPRIRMCRRFFIMFLYYHLS